MGFYAAVVLVLEVPRGIGAAPLQAILILCTLPKPFLVARLPTILLLAVCQRTSSSAACLSALVFLHACLLIFCCDQPMSDQMSYHVMSMPAA
jgi:hypothetical protein